MSYKFEEYPKFATLKLPSGRIINLVWPPKHVLAGQYVTFNSAAEEKAFDPKTAVPESIVPQVHRGEDVHWRAAHSRVIGKEI